MDTSPRFAHTAGPRGLLRPLLLSVLCAGAALPLAGGAASVITDEDIARFGGAGDATGVDGAGTQHPAPGCALLAPDAPQATTRTCTACHGLSRTHPIDVDYALAAARAPERYRPVEEVVRAGGLLPEGQIRCVTCHDGASPWRYRLALPAGAIAAPSVAAMRADPASFPELRVRPLSPPPPPGSDVTPTPLCRLCHVT